jgi:hypothetical protein
MPAKKGTRKKATKKAEPTVVYVDKSLPLSEVEIAGALNVPEDDPQRRAIMQILDYEIDLAAGMLQGKCENHGVAAERVGWFTALRYIKQELESTYGNSVNVLRENANMEEPSTETTGY